MISLNKTIKKATCFFIVISVILNSGSALSLIAPSFCFYFLFATFCVLLCVFFNRVKTSKLHITDLNMNILILIFISISSLIVNSDYAYLSSLFRYLIVILTAYIITSIWDIKHVLKVYISVIYYISLISLVFYCLGLIFPFFISSFPTMKSETTTYYSILIYNITTYSFKRNMGIFWEPSLFSSFLCLAIFFQYHFFRKDSKIKLIVLIITLLTTQSTGGYLCFLLIVFSFFSQGKKTKYYFLYNCLIIFAIFFFILNWNNILDFLYKLNPLVFQKLFDKTDNISYSARMLCPTINLELFYSNPIFGNSIGNTNMMFYFKTKGLVSQTSMTTYYLATFGLLSIITPITFAKSVFKRKKFSVITRIIFVISFFIIINKESHFYFVMTYIIIFVFMNDIKARRSRH